MALTETEKGILDGLVVAERARQLHADAPNPHWLIENIEDNTMRSEALRLVQDARAVKQAEVSAWPVQAQARFAELEAERDALVALETKLTP